VFPKIGDVLFIGADNLRVEITERNRTAFSLDCEYCAKQRLDKQRRKYQSTSMLTETECGYRLSSIVTTGRADTAEMVKACLEMVCGQASMLTFWGSSGNAKSVALIATVNEFLDRDIPAIYVPSYDLLNWIQDAFSNQGRDIKSESAYDRLEMFKRVTVLAVDELQGIKVTDWRLEQLRNLIDYRWRAGMDGKKYTLFAMNESPDGLEPRIYSRLKDGRNRANGQDAILLNEDKDMRPLLRRKA
jgi:DNA replication protein DnaC